MLLLRTRATAFKSQVKVLNSTTKEELELELARPSKTVSKDGFSSYDVILSAIKAKKPRLLSVSNWEGFGSAFKSADWFKSMGPLPEQTERKALTYKRDSWPMNETDSFPDYHPTAKPAAGPFVLP